MYVQTLFLKRCDQMELLARSSDHVELLDLAGLLRQMLCDSNSLLDLVNRGRVTIQLKVKNKPKPCPELDRGLVLFYDPPYPPPGSQKVTVLTPAAFLQHELIILRGEGISVKSLIRYAANVSGGVHYDPKPKPEYKASSSLSNLSLLGIPITVGVLRDIALIFLEGVQRLRQDVYEEVQKTAEAHKQLRRSIGLVDNS